MIGTTIGKYQIVGQLGRGGTGIVYKAVDETLGREVAIKILNPDLADSDIIKRFQVEATALAKLNHPGIATIYELFRSENDLLMVMELVRGETLEKLADRLGPLDPQQAVYIVDQLLSALAHAHRAGVVHRDIKPSNVMVTSEGIVKIMDFGVARVRDAEHTTSRGRLVGTPAYMPPEQVLGDKVDQRSDLYSVGVVFYRLLTGALPFESDTSIGMLQRHVSETPIPLRAHREGLPDWCESTIQRAMAKSPEDRFQSADEFREALAHATGMATTVDVEKMFAAGESDAAGAAAQKPDTVVIARGELTPEVAVPRDRPSRRHFALGASTLTLVVAALLAFAYSGLPRHPSRENAQAPVPQPVAQKPAAPPKALVATATTPTVKPSGGAAAPPKTTAVAGAAAPAGTTAARNTAAPSPAPTKPTTVGDTRDPAEKFPVLVFDAKALVPKGDREQERDAQLVLADGKLTVTADDTQTELYSVPYNEVVSIYYSRGRDPMWKSPRGPEAAAHTGGGIFRKLGINQERHWITVRTGPDRFIILRVRDTLVGPVLSALQKRTGRRPYRFDDLPTDAS